MPGPSQQLRYSQEPPWLHRTPLLNGMIKPIPEFKGQISREEPGLKFCEPELRRKDIGYQTYAGGNYEPTYVNEPIIGTVPTARAFFFLRDQYPDTSLPRPPTRFFR